MGARQDAETLRNLPENWQALFAPVPGGRSGKLRCLLCGRTGLPPHWWGLREWSTTFDGKPIVVRPHGWQLSCIRGHHVRCETCRRPFTNGTALRGHQTCKSHHACCHEHTHVPEWKNPFAVQAR